MPAARRLPASWRRRSRLGSRYCHRLATFLSHRGFPGGGALRLLRATKPHSAVAPVSGSATGVLRPLLPAVSASTMIKLKAGRTDRRPDKAPAAIRQNTRTMPGPGLRFQHIPIQPLNTIGIRFAINPLQLRRKARQHIDPLFQREEVA